MTPNQAESVAADAITLTQNVPTNVLPSSQDAKSFIVGPRLPRPLPIPHLRHVLAVLADVRLVIDKFVADELFRVGRARSKARHAVNHVADKMETIKVGGFDFFLEGRGQREDQDGGPSLQILGTSNGAQVQLLRFDMFRINPHYHYAPDGKNIRYLVDPLTLDDPVSWVFDLIGNRLPQMLAKAGYEELATPANLAAVKTALPNLKQRCRAIAND